MGGGASPSPALTVVIPTLGNHAVLRRVLDGYDRQTVDPSRFELVVVADQAEPDPDAIDAMLAGRRYDARRLRGTVPGASANRNVGWRAARAPLVLFTDDDTIPVPRLVAEHLDWHARFPAAEFAVLGHIRWAKGISVTPFMKWLDRSVQFDYPSIHGTDATWAHLYSANSSLKRTLLERVGGYDEVRFPYGYEDLDLGYRADRLGLQVKYNRRAIVDHWRTMTVENWQVRAPRLARSERAFCEAYPEIEPYFHAMLMEVAGRPPGGRKAARAARFVPLRTPWIGALVWRTASIHWRQQIAPYFLREWDRIAAGEASGVASAAAALAERGSEHGRSAP
jgi:GT2 family glycosyltransferase